MSDAIAQVTNIMVPHKAERRGRRIHGSPTPACTRCAAQCHDDGHTQAVIYGPARGRPRRPGAALAFFQGV